MTDNLDMLRRRMDLVTTEMVQLLLERTEISAEIGRIKKEIGKDVTDEEREAQLRQNVLSLCRERGQDDKNDDRKLHDTATTEQITARFLNFLLNESVRTQSMAHNGDGSTGTTHLSVFQKAKQLERSGRPIIHMEVGEPDFMPPSEVGKALAESYDTGHVRYGSPRGMPELLDALASHASEKFGAGVRSDNIMVSPGGRFAVFAATSVLLHPGDEVIIVEPAWPAYRQCAMHAGAKVRTIRTSMENSWTPSISEIQDMINSNTQMIVLNYPNNPTGRVLPTRVMDGIMEIASEHSLYVLGDEIYSEYTNSNNNTSWRSVTSYHYDRGIAIQSFSKSHAMTGLRIGYAMANDKTIIDRMASLSALCLTSVSAPVQYAALRALNADILGNVAVMSERLDILKQEACKMNLEFVPPDGGMYLFVRVPGGDCTRIVDRMLTEYDVALAPGIGFGPYHDHIRISACADTKNLIRGMNRLKSMLNRGTS